jgi:hypothetical protein
VVAVNEPSGVDDAPNVPDGQERAGVQRILESRKKRRENHNREVLECVLVRALNTVKLLLVLVIVRRVFAAP